MNISVKTKFKNHINDEYTRMENIIKILKRLLGVNHARFFVGTLMKDPSSRSMHRYLAIPCKPETDSCIINKNTDQPPFHILTGLYFPSKYYNIGDIVTIRIGSLELCTLTIDDLNKIYKPFCDFYWIYLVYLQAHHILIDTKGKPFFAIGLNVPSEMTYYDMEIISTNHIDPITKSLRLHIAPNGTYIEYNGGMGYIDKSVRRSTYELPPYINAANLIKRCIRQHIQNKELHASMSTLVVTI